MAPARPADLQLQTGYWAQVRTKKACQGRHPEPGELQPGAQAEGKGV